MSFLFSPYAFLTLINTRETFAKLISIRIFYCYLWCIKSEIAEETIVQVRFIVCIASRKSAVFFRKVILMTLSEIVRTFKFLV